MATLSTNAHPVCSLQLVISVVSSEWPPAKVPLSIHLRRLVTGASSVVLVVVAVVVVVVGVGVGGGQADDKLACRLSDWPSHLWSDWRVATQINSADEATLIMPTTLMGPILS